MEAGHASARFRNRCPQAIPPFSTFAGERAPTSIAWWVVAPVAEMVEITCQKGSEKQRKGYLLQADFTSLLVPSRERKSYIPPSFICTLNPRWPIPRKCPLSLTSLMSAQATSILGG